MNHPRTGLSCDTTQPHSAREPSLRRLLPLLIPSLLLACTEPEGKGGADAAVTLVDHSVSSTFLDRSLGHFKRGRTCAVADFDGDDRLDVFVGSPADPLIVAHNRTTDPSDPQFEIEPVSGYGHTWWSSATLDLDLDGLTDVLAGTGGNETEELDQILRNLGGSFELVEAEVPVAGAPDFFGDPLPSATAGIRWADLDLDGDIDLFLSTNILEPGEYRGLGEEQPQGRDRVLLNDGLGGFHEAAVEVGLDERATSFNSTLFDYDNDGDVDLYQNTLVGLNRVWRNELVETGTLSFTDATYDVSPDGEVRMVDPLIKGFSTAAADLNNDGWEDLIVWHRGPARKKHPMDWHLVWLNLGGERFVEVGRLTGMADRWHECEDLGRGVMGSQVGDLDLDGFPDVFIGNGSPDGGCANQLWLSDGLEPLDVDGWGTVQVPVFRDASEQIDRPVDGTPEVPYPYRTHGACLADYDNDGMPELAFVNGGPGYAEDWVREPNRYFDLQLDPAPHFLSIRPVGDGVNVATEAIGTRVRVTVRRSSDGAEWTLHQVLYGGNGFSAHNGPELYLGLADADEIVELAVRWPDGVWETVDGVGVDQRVVVER